MKKFVLLMLILGLTSYAQAGVIGLYINGSQEYAGTAGETVTIELIADSGCSGASFSTLVEGDAAIATTQIDMGGTVTLPTYTDSDFSIGSESGYLDNYQGALFSVLSGTAVPAVTAGSVILSFEYTISFSWDGATGYWVSPLIADATYTYDGGTMSAVNSYGALGEAGGGDILITGVHIIPEPMTISLLSLGGLIALRRRKK